MNNLEVMYKHLAFTNILKKYNFKRQKNSVLIIVVFFVEPKRGKFFNITRNNYFPIIRQYSESAELYQKLFL